MTYSLKQRVFKGVSWSFADNIANSGITFLVGLILARILSPAEFGIIGIVTIFIAISNSIIDSGFSNALIRKNNARDIDYNTVFYFNLGVGIFFYIVLYFCAPLISHFFHEPLLIPVIKIIGLVLIINSLAIIQRTLFIKKVDFKTQTKISLCASISSGIIGIGMALKGFGVWSLVGQQISRQFINTTLFWIYSKWRPAWQFSKTSFNELFSFGSKLLLAGLIDTIWKNIYYLVIGRFYSAGQLGQYTRAEQFNTIFSSNLTAVVQRVSYPTLSSIQDEAERLRSAYQKIIKVTMLVAFTCMLGLAAISKSLVIVLIGEKWMEAASFLQIICFSGMLYPLHALNLNILQVKGRSDLFLKLEIIKKAIAVLPIIFGIFFGIKYMLLGSVGTSFIGYLLNSHYSADLINYSSKDQIKDILPTFCIAFGVALCMWSFSLLQISNLLILIIQCTFGLLAVLLLYEKLGLSEYQEIKQMLFTILKRK